MSLAINPDHITRVLLADGWHPVHNTSFNIDSYEFVWRDLIVHGGGQSGITAAGYIFTTDGGVILCGPLTSVLAVELKPKRTQDAA